MADCGKKKKRPSRPPLIIKAIRDLVRGKPKKKALKKAVKKDSTKVVKKDSTKTKKPVKKPAKKKVKK